MTIDHLFAAVFLSQVLVVSLYAPSRVLRRARTLLATRPPAEYPKLYPVPVATIERTLRLYRSLNSGFAVLGLALLASAWYYGYTIDPAWQFGDIPARNPLPAYAIYLLVQLTPIGLWGYWEWRYFQRMRAAAPNGIRRAELRPRRMRDFVAPALLGTVVATYLGATVALVLLGAASVRHALPMSTYMFSVMTIGNLFAAGMLVWILRGRKWDPHQTPDDRTRMIRGVWQSLVVAIILLNVFVAIQSLLIGSRLLHYVPFLVSLFIQIAAVISTKKFNMVVALDQENFEVYKADANRA